MSTIRKEHWLGAAGAIFVVLAWHWYQQPARLPLVTPTRLDQALQQWKMSGPDNYQITIDVQGPQPGQYQVEVRNKMAREAKFNGRALPPDRTLGTWSVVGMFANLERDLAHQTRAETQKDVSQLILRGEFDARYGFPAKYERTDWGSQAPIRWQVTRFDVIPHDESAESQP